MGGDGGIRGSPLLMYVSLCTGDSYSHVYVVEKVESAAGRGTRPYGHVARIRTDDRAGPRGVALISIFGEQPNRRRGWTPQDSRPPPLVVMHPALQRQHGISPAEPLRGQTRLSAEAGEPQASKGGRHQYRPPMPCTYTDGNLSLRYDNLVDPKKIVCPTPTDE